MILKFRVYEQTISLQSTKSEPRQGSKDYLELQFSFSADWNDLLKYVYIQHGDVSVPHELAGGSVIVDEYFTEQTEFNVTLFGRNADGSVEVPTNVVTVFLKESNNLWEKDAPEPQNSWVVQVVDAKDKALAAAIRAENAAIHQPYPNSETETWWVWDASAGAYTNTGISYKGESSVQSDWNQNDDTQPDYVKNRPFYEGDPTVLLEESTIPFADGGFGLYMASFSISSETTEDISKGVWRISWDGTVYNCTTGYLNETFVVGNLSILRAGSDTGEPFIIGISDVQGSFIGTADTSDSHTLSISHVSVVTLDESYLPSTVPFMKAGKIPEEYLPEKFPDVQRVFGSFLIVEEHESTLANPYPNKTILKNLTVEAFNALLNDIENGLRYVMIENNVASLHVYHSDRTIGVSWSSYSVFRSSGKPLDGAWLKVYDAKVHEDTDNPGTIISECAVVFLAKKYLT